MSALSNNDPCSFACPEECQVVGIDLDLDVDFNEHVLRGCVHLTLDKKKEDAECVILDTRGLTIKGITDQSTGQKLTYTLGEAVDSFGSKLEVKLPQTAEKQFVISVEYETSPKCSALQWLKKEQTAGKRQPYLFSQCQAIHARSLVPCQDTPSVKCWYNAKVSALREITILMSAVRNKPEPHPTDDTKLVHKFEQKVPIPSYLIAIVGGDLESRKLGPRSHVWSEKEYVDQAAFEFSETEQMLKTAEDLLGPYVWGQYDLLVLPPSFPYGGMENPCLTFVTPTLLAGDKSLADVVAHEISHSWTGNLVTNRTWEDFWLNEGHTVFVERKITARLHNSEPMRSFMALGGWQDLQYSVDVFESGPYTKLVPDLKGVDPDDAFSTVPYEKGFTLLYYLENLVGGPDVFEPFLRSYIDNFKYQSISTAQWKDYLYSYFHEMVDKGVFKDVDWDAWFYSTGMPPVKPNYDESLAVVCKDLCKRWSTAADDDLSQFIGDDLKDLSSVQVREFVGLLVEEAPLTVTKVQTMEKLYKLNSVKNSEIRFRWLRLCIKAEWEECIPRALDFVNEQGRMKFVKPIYRDLYNWETARERAIKNFETQLPTMHSTTAGLVAKILKLSQ